MDGTPFDLKPFLSLAGPEGSRPFDRLVRGKAPAGAKDAVAKSGLPPLAQGALYLCLDCFDEAHDAANAHEGTAAGNWIHAILHRREPDAGNARYWYARVSLPEGTGRTLAREALKVLGPEPPEDLAKLAERLAKSGAWDPEAFVGLCDRYRQGKNEGPAYQALARLQWIEWEALLGSVGKDL